jgi:hypothetical protein
MVTCAPVVSQYAAIAALELGEPFIEQFRQEFRRRRARIIEHLDALPQVFDYQRPNASYYAFPRIKDTVPLARDSRALARDILARAHVALVPGAAFGPTGESHLRFCYARELADIDRAFDRLGDYFAGRGPRLLPAPAVQTIAAPRRGPLRQAGVRLLHALARFYVQRTHPRLIAIAGGRGKTVLKLTLVELLLEARMNVRSNPLSYNTDVGLAFAILDTRFDTKRPAEVLRGLGRAVRNAFFLGRRDVLVLELGARQVGDMKELLRVVQPQIAVITELGPSYSEDQEGIAVLRQEMKELVDFVAGSGGKLLISGDDLVLAELASPDAERFRRADLVDAAGSSVLRLGTASYPVGREIVGDSSLLALDASVLVARHLGIGDEVIRRFLA